MQSIEAAVLELGPDITFHTMRMKSVCTKKDHLLIEEKKSLKKTFVSVKSHVVCGCKL